MPNKKSKSLAKIYPSETLRGSSNPSLPSKTIDVKTKQKVFFECNVCILGRSKLNRDEMFAAEKAEVLMNRMYNQRLSHCRLYCLSDSMRFVKSKTFSGMPLRNFVLYKSIQRIFVFEEKPDVFMLCVDSGRAKKRTYEGYHFKTPEDVKTVCGLIYRAREQADCILEERNSYEPIGSNTVLRPYSDMDITAEDLRVPSTNSIMRPLSMVNISSNEIETYDSELIQSPALQRKPGVRSVHLKPQKSVPLQGEKIREYTVHIDRDSAQQRSEPDSISARLEQTDWEVNVTYLSWDNKRGAIINDRGPVYMYLARYSR